MAHSFGGMILTEAGVASNVSAVVYVTPRAPDAGEDYTALSLISQPDTIANLILEAVGQS